MHLVPFVLGHTAGDPGPAHRVFLGEEDHEEEVPDHNGRNSEDRFPEVDGFADAHQPAGCPTRCNSREPEHHTGHAHHHSSPDQRPILGFGGVVIHSEAGRMLLETGVIKKVADNFADVGEFRD